MESVCSNLLHDIGAAHHALTTLKGICFIINMITHSVVCAVNG